MNSTIESNWEKLWYIFVSVFLNLAVSPSYCRKEIYQIVATGGNFMILHIESHSSKRWKVALIRRFCEENLIRSRRRIKGPSINLVDRFFFLVFLIPFPPSWTLLLYKAIWQTPPPQLSTWFMGAPLEKKGILKSFAIDLVFE